MLLLFRKFSAKIGERDGFTLIELVMVIVIASIAFPSMITMYTSVYTNSHNAEFMTAASLLAIEQMEIILADKAGVGAGYGYAAITNEKYAAVNPPAPFNVFTRTVNVVNVNINGDPAYPAKQITVTVNHSKIPSVIIQTLITDHSGL